MSIDTAFLSAFRIRIAEERQRAVDNLVSGRLLDHSEYRYSCGYIKALDDEITIAEETLTAMQKG